MRVRLIFMLAVRRVVAHRLHFICWTGFTRLMAAIVQKIFDDSDELYTREYFTKLD